MTLAAAGVNSEGPSGAATAPWPRPDWRIVGLALALLPGGARYVDEAASCRQAAR